MSSSYCRNIGLSWRRNKTCWGCWLEIDTQLFAGYRESHHSGVFFFFFFMRQPIFVIVGEDFRPKWSNKTKCGYVSYFYLHNQPRRDSSSLQALSTRHVSMQQRKPTRFSMILTKWDRHLFPEHSISRLCAEKILSELVLSPETFCRSVEGIGDKMIVELGSSWAVYASWDNTIRTYGHAKFQRISVPSYL